ncbi:Myb domain plants domain-containing protein [Dioscorea alata]|uniref:Myb domain plants domain-containing protein n=2 Tax=Dioscorea alata TaxID=55571 RepID=A0ACB7U9U5_DIOAL|nr:Myb domain plants domain-containing protein [Dioscorea alata]KAH7657092.1 Myb domain plants domain-containing protein [Dioscorea alata]
MTKWGVEVLPPASSYFGNSNWFLGQNRSVIWTASENKIFENALAYIDSDTPNRWKMVAEMLPGKSVDDVITHYRDLEHDVSHIEAGLIPVPGYSSPSFTLDWESSNLGFEGLRQAYGAVAGKRAAGRFSEQERKKGVPWTEDEHRKFLMGLKKYGKGDWRNISRNFVPTRTPTQVASHAQKYFIRLSSGGKDKRRSSIHDITTVNLPDDNPVSPTHASSLSTQSSSVVLPGTPDKFCVKLEPNNCTEAARTMSGTSIQMHTNRVVQPSYGVTPYQLKLQAQSPNKSSFGSSIMGVNHSMFRTLSAQLHPHG